MRERWCALGAEYVCGKIGKNEQTAGIDKFVSINEIIFQGFNLVPARDRN